LDLFDVTRQLQRAVVVAENLAIVERAEEEKAQEKTARRRAPVSSFRCFAVHLGFSERRLLLRKPK